MAGMVGCSIPDDIPYPTVESEITEFAVQGQCDESGEGEATATIDRRNRSIHVFVNDLVDISDLTVTQLSVTNDAAVIIDSTVCVKSSTYEVRDLPHLAPNSAIHINATKEIPITLQTYQQYNWVLTVDQIIKREIEVEGQVGNAIIDPDTHIAIIYVNESQDLRRIRVKKFNLGGPHGEVTPNPIDEEAVDFTTSQRYYVKEAWSDLVYMWTVFVYTTSEAIQGTAEAKTTAKGATVISGNRPNGVIPIIEYRTESESAWTTVPASDISYPTATTYEVIFKALHSDVKYLYHVKFNDTQTIDQSFYFEGEQMENSSFEDWHVESKGGNDLFLPWAEGDEGYWDTGNHGATTVGASNSTFIDEDGRRYAYLQSKYIVIKFAAGNIFTGKYLETDGTNGVLSFGRPFSSRPAKMQFDYQYKTSPITRTGGEWKENWGKYISRQMYETMKGKPDSCSIYIALGDWEPVQYKNYTCPYLIRTRPSELHLMDMNDSHIIGFAQLTRGEDVNTWTTEQLTIDYRNDRTPTTIIVVAASSKYGDYFTGGEQSLLKIDNFRLIY